MQCIQGKECRTAALVDVVWCMSVHAGAFVRAVRVPCVFGAGLRGAVQVGPRGTALGHWGAGTRKAHFTWGSGQGHAARSVYSTYKEEGRALYAVLYWSTMLRARVC